MVVAVYVLTRVASSRLDNPNIDLWWVAEGVGFLVSFLVRCSCGDAPAPTILLLPRCSSSFAADPMVVSVTTASVSAL